MAFTGQSGSLTLVQILGLIHNCEEKRFLKIQTDDTRWCIECSSGRLVAISADPLDSDLEDIFIERKLLKASILKQLDDEEVKESGLDTILVREGHATQEQADRARYHLAEHLFFLLLKEISGEFEWVEKPLLKLWELGSGFKDFVSQTYTDLDFAKKFRTYFNDFDRRLFWITPANQPNLPDELSFKEIQLLSRYKPNISIREFWQDMGDPVKKTSELLISLSERQILNVNPPGSAKIPNSKPFLRSLLARVTDKLLDFHQEIGENNQMFEVLQSINENLEKMPEFSAAIKSEELGDLSSIAGSLDGLLDLNGVEELNLEQDMGESKGAQKTKKKSASNLEKPVRPSKKAGSSRQPKKSTVSSKNNSNLSDSAIERKMEPNPQRSKEAQAIIDASKNMILEGASLEEKVDAKVRYRKFASEVNMVFNRFTMTNQTLFETFGLAPHATRKDIHKSFVKAINSINPKGIQFTNLDLESVEKAIFMRDQLKKAYITLMDDKKKRRYIDSLRETRQAAESNKQKAMDLFNQGMEKVRAGKFDEAREIFRRAAKFDPNSPVYYSVLEDIDKEEREGNAVKFFQAGILAFKQKNDYDRAIKLIRKAISLRPLDPTYHLKLAEIQAMSGDHKNDAVDSYLNALDLDPGNQELRLLIANFQKNLGRKQEAADMYQSIIKWNPDHSVVKKHLLELEKEGIKPTHEEKSEKEKKKDAGQALNEEFE